MNLHLPAPLVRWWRRLFARKPLTVTPPPFPRLATFAIEADAARQQAWYRIFCLSRDIQAAERRLFLALEDYQRRYGG